MQKGISGRQIFFLMCLTLTTYTIISMPRIMAQHAGTGAWLPILLTAAGFAPFAVVVIRLGLLFPDRTLFEYSREIAGKFLGCLFSVYYALYFLMIAVYLNLQLVNVLNAEFFPKTPKGVTLFVGILVFGCIASKGATSAARFFEIIGPVFLVTAFVVHTVMLTQGNVNSILPFFRPSRLPDYLSAMRETVVAFLGIEIFTALPMSHEKGKRKMLTALLSVVYVGFFYVLVVETCIMMLGMRDIQNYSYALIEAIKLIDNPILERFDILYLTVGFAGLIAGVSGVYLALTEYTCRFMPKVNRRVVVFFLGILIMVLCLVSMGLKNADEFFGKAIPMLGLPAAFLLPVLLTVIAGVRHLGQKTR